MIVPAQSCTESQCTSGFLCYETQCVRQTCNQVVSGERSELVVPTCKQCNNVERHHSTSCGHSPCCSKLQNEVVRQTQGVHTTHYVYTYKDAGWPVHTVMVVAKAYQVTSDKAGIHAVSYTSTTEGNHLERLDFDYT